MQSTLARFPLGSVLVLSVLTAGCFSEATSPRDTAVGCRGASYPDAGTSPYVLPFAVGTVIPTGLGNCSRSYHAAGRPDQYATDFDMPPGTPFVAARAGVVAAVDEDEPSEGGGAGNFVLVDHGDDTWAYYLHAPRDGIWVDVGDQVAQGDTLGVVGRSGLAGYPHLHFIVVKGDPAFPYQAIPVAFRNARPAHVPLQSYAWYEVMSY